MHGLHAASPAALSAITRDQPAIVYEGLLAVLLRLVFLLYAEDRGLIPSRDDPMARAFYEQGYGVRALHTRLLEDAAPHPDTMEERQGAWHRLLALFRLVHVGDDTGWMRGRGGKLFDPAAFPFLQGQTVPTDPIRVPPVSDGCILRVLDGLLTLAGERLSYRALDVEQIGSVYETVTAPIVQHALAPALERIGPDATPEAVLSLKVCDPAMGSGAFLVEACRQLAARLVDAWRVHQDKRPVLPPDEDEELHVKRLVAQRCLYGVDRNPMATDLARLSLCR